MLTLKNSKIIISAVLFAALTFATACSQKKEEAVEQGKINDVTAQESTDFTVKSEYDSSKISLVNSATGEVNEGAVQEIEGLKSAVTSSAQWKEYMSYKNGLYKSDIDKYNIRKLDDGDSVGNYILDYSSDDFNVSINVYSDEITIYLTDGNRADIAVFR